MLMLTGIAQAVKVDAQGMLRGAKGFLDPHKFREVRSVYPASEGAFWVVGVDWNWGQGGQWYACLFGNNGERLSGDILVLPKPGLDYLSAVEPIGTLPDGSLVVDVAERAPESHQRLAKVRPDGHTEVTGVIPAHETGQPYVDRNGVVHVLVLALGNMGYMQVDMVEKGLPTIRSLLYDQPSGSLPSAPGYLRWAHQRPGGPIAGAFFSDGPQRLLVETPRRVVDDSICHLYSVNSRTLALIDSGQINLIRDIYRMWTGPSIRGTVIVRSGKTGYWLFANTGDTAPNPTVVAYRVRPDLTVERPHTAAAAAAGPFSDAPADAVVAVFCVFKRPREAMEDNTLAAHVRVRLKFSALSSDGQLYYQVLEDSIVSHQTK